MTLLHNAEIGLAEWRAWRLAGIVDENVDWPQSRPRGVMAACDRLLVGHVETVGDKVCLRSQRLGNRLQWRPPTAGQGNARALGGEASGDCRADAAAGAGDERVSPIKGAPAHFGAPAAVAARARPVSYWARPD